MNADTPFDVWGAFIHADGILFVSAVSLEVTREVEEVGVRVVEGGRIVLVGKLSPQHIDAHTFTPFEFVDERNAVEQPSVQVPLHKH